MNFLSNFFSALLFGVLLFSSLPVFSATVEVCPSCPVHILRDALEKAAPGDTVAVKGGVYREGMLTIDKPLHLIGTNRPILDGLNQKHVLFIKADDVTVEGFLVENSGVSTVEEYAGIRVEESKGCRFFDNVLKNNTYSFYLAKVDDCLLEKNDATGNARGEVTGGNGIHLWYSSHITVRRNTLSHQRDGIYLEFTTDSLLEENVSTHNLRYGLHFMYSHRNRYYGNRFVENQTGVAVMYSRHIQMVGNRFEKSWGRAAYGLLLKDISDSLIQGNAFYANTVGIFADEISRDRFVENTFKNNGWALNILGSSEDNVFRENNFLANFFDVATNSRQSGNLFEENYWDHYRGYDLNHDHVGDVPFRPMKIFSLWVSKYPELVVLLQSPVIEFLEVAERVFPVLTPKSMQDERPRMKPFQASS
ncbi:MAG: nitrous oxide reductase family maturation protein NosD [bacterium]